MELRAARRRGSDSSADDRPQPLMQLVVKLRRALAELDADLRAEGFGQNSRGLAHELYASFTATIIATRGTNSEATPWALGHALAIDLDRAGKRRGALALLEGLIELSASQGHPQVLARLTSAAEAIEQTMGRRRGAAAKTDKVSDDPSAAAISPEQGSPAQDVGGELARPTHESERPTPTIVAPPTDSHFGSEPDPGEQYGKRNEEQPSDGEEGGRNPIGRQEPGSSHVASELFGERSLPIGPHERPVSPPSDPLAPRRRSRRGGVIIAAAASALVGIALYLLVTHDGNLIRHSLSTLTSAVTSPIDAFLANAPASKTPTASVPNGSSSIAATGAPAMRTVGRTAADATEKSPPQVQSQFLSSEEARYAKARQDQLTADATRILASRGPKPGTPLLDLKTRDAAAAVQTKLKALGYYHYTVDGIWGPMSAAALSTFRQEKGLSSDGVWDVAAQSALLGN